MIWNLFAFFFFFVESKPNNSSKALEVFQFDVNQNLTKLIGFKGSSFILNCTNAVLLNSKVSWTKNENILTENSKKLTRDFLLLTNVTVKDSGNYSCRFCDDSNDCIVNTFDVNILGEPGVPFFFVFVF